MPRVVLAPGEIPARRDRRDLPLSPPKPAHDWRACRPSEPGRFKNLWPMCSIPNGFGPPCIVVNLTAMVGVGSGDLKTSKPSEEISFTLGGPPRLPYSQTRHFCKIPLPQPSAALFSRLHELGITATFWGKEVTPVAANPEEYDYVDAMAWM